MWLLVMPASGLVSLLRKGTREKQEGNEKHPPRGPRLPLITAAMPSKSLASIKRTLRESVPKVRVRGGRVAAPSLGYAATPPEPGPSAELGRSDVGEGQGRRRIHMRKLNGTLLPRPRATALLLSSSPWPACHVRRGVRRPGRT